MQEILDQIANTGYYIHCPSKWNKHEEALADLCHNKVIVRLNKVLGQGSINNAYTYIRNPEHAHKLTPFQIFLICKIIFDAVVDWRGRLDVAGETNEYDQYIDDTINQHPLLPAAKLLRESELFYELEDNFIP